MIKTIYVSAWILAGAAALNSLLTGGFDPAAMVAFSVVAVGLVYAFALWSVTFNTTDPQPQRIKQ